MLKDVTNSDKLKLLKKLDWNNSIEVQREGIKEGLQEDDLSIFILPVIPGFNKSKQVWENCTRILYHKSDEELISYLEEMFEWLQDLNVPGALIISKRLYEFSKNNKDVFNSVKDKCIQRATDNNDKIWIDVINEIEENAENFWCPDINI